MRLPDTAHTTRGWRIHAVAPDFRLEDVWALPTPGGPDDFPRLVHAWTRQDPTRHQSATVRALFRIRLNLGEQFGWDDAETDATLRVPSLVDRVPNDLRVAPRPEFATLPFTTLYMTHNEFAAEAANRTMHGVLHLGWVPDDTADGGYRGQLAILVKRNGVLGAAYMAGIAPFRHLIIYPQIVRSIGREWAAARDEPTLLTPTMR